MNKKRKTRRGLNHYLVYGYIPKLALQIHEFVQEVSKQQAIKVVGDNLRRKYSRLLIPPLGEYCNVIKTRPPKSSA